nr:hypothetical protein [Ilumatobacteraceae bacterium]
AGSLGWALAVTLESAAKVRTLGQVEMLLAFAIGTVYAKTEVIQVAVFAAVIAGEPLAPAGWAGVAICLIGVAWLASGGALGSLLRRAGDPAARFGVAAGAGFALAAVGIREASRSLGDAPTLDRATLTLAAMLTIQLVLNGTQLAVTDRAELGRTVASWRREAPVGLLSLAGSLGWARRVARVGAGGHARERRQGAHARAGRDAARVRDRLADGRAPPPRRVRGERRGPRGHPRGGGARVSQRAKSSRRGITTIVPSSSWCTVTRTP